MFVSMGKGKLAPPIAYDNYFREDVPPSAGMTPINFPESVDGR